ncbi:E3 ubiquitin-protein ligase makorin-1 [Elysia marginata]|uniref:RING-type E3 ubiquitin transferase n=1 Tax=Elysia marginata TaxID=1093978 RepID=A0AAV4IA76_9GAST|nr:E3 ubiquitin-protein ligase makorin-1 [Elysia marginata]
MAEGGNPVPVKDNTVCKYFIHGACSKGPGCRYVHDRSGTVPSDNICKYYKQGQCFYGRRCRYDHVKNETSRNSSNQSRPAERQANTRSTDTPQPKQTKSSRTMPEPRQSQLVTLNSRTMPEPRQSQLVTLNSRTMPEPRQSQLVTLNRAMPEARKPQMVTLSKKRQDGDHDFKRLQKKQEEDAKWAQAKAFVPGQKYCGACPSSYAAAIGGDDDMYKEAASEEYGHLRSLESEECDYWNNMEFASYELAGTGIGGMPHELVTADTPLCPFYAAGECRNSDDCSYVHGDICDMCGLPQLHPKNKQQQDEHRKECLANHEKEMEKAFAVAASENKECGICLERVPDTAGGRFGILEKCNHCFCLACIRQWRGHKEDSLEMQRTCPTCRTHSDFITPSKYWVETSEEKEKLINDYKKALKQKPCKYFKNGKGACPFNRKCFYLHALPDGTKAEENLVKTRRWVNAEGEATSEDYSLWNFMERRDENDVGTLSARLFDMLGDAFNDSFDGDLSRVSNYFSESSSSDD